MTSPPKVNSRWSTSTWGVIIIVVRLANVVVVYVDGVELVAVQDEGFACALCLNSEEVREEVGRSDGSRFAGAGSSGAGSSGSSGSCS